MFERDTAIEYSNGQVAYVGDVLQEAGAHYALLMNDEGRYAAAYWFEGDEGWCFVIEDEDTWRLHKYQALQDIAQGMRETSLM